MKTLGKAAPPKGEISAKNKSAMAGPEKLGYGTGGYDLMVSTRTLRATTPSSVHTHFFFFFFFYPCRYHPYASVARYVHKSAVELPCPRGPMATAWARGAFGMPGSVGVSSVVSYGPYGAGTWNGDE